MSTGKLNAKSIISEIPMTTNYQKIWNTMNSLETVVSKVCSAREILNCALDALESHDIEKTETLICAADEFLQYYLKDFDEKFKEAWKETVVNSKPKAPSWDGIDFSDPPKKDKVIKWSLPVEEVDDEYYITLPDDLLDAADLLPGDEVEWISQNNGSYILKKIPKTYDERVAAGWTMTDDGFWIKE